MTDKEKIKFWAKGRLFEIMNGIGENDAKNILTDFLSFIDSMQEEHCTETEFREIEVLKTKLSKIAQTIYHHEGPENPTVERIREIVQDCCYELIDLEKPVDYAKPNAMLDDSLSKETKESWNERLGKEEPVSEKLEQAIDTYLKSYWGGEKEKQDWPFLKKMAIHFAKWQKEQIEEALLSEVLPCFMHGGEVDEVVAKLDEVLNKKK